MPQAAIVIVTRNRKEKARAAVESALAQDGDNEIIIMDDASTDGTLEYLGGLFPQIKIIRNEAQEGLIVLRSRSAKIVSSPVIVSIDDDAVFSDNFIVRDTLAMMTDPRVGAVAIPHANYSPDGSFHVWWPAVPDPAKAYIVSNFIGTAYAVRTAVFQQLGGFQDVLFQWGEESEYAQRLFAAGYVVRLGVSGLIRHYPAGAGKYSRQVNRYILRNRILTAWFNAPLMYFLPAVVLLPIRGLIGSLRSFQNLATTFEAIGMAFSGIWRFRRLRRPIPLEAFRVWQDIRKRKLVPLDETDIWDGNFPVPSPMYAGEKVRMRGRFGGCAAREDTPSSQPSPPSTGEKEQDR